MKITKSELRKLIKEELLKEFIKSDGDEVGQMLSMCVDAMGYQHTLSVLVRKLEKANASLVIDVFNEIMDENNILY